MSVRLKLILEEIPASLCSSIQTIQQLFQSIVTYTRIELPEWATSLVKSTTPPEDVNATWMKLDSSLRPVGLCTYASGAWIRKNPVLPGTTIMWTEALPDFDTFDGGDNSGVIGAVSGHMWEEVTEMRGRIAIGVGTLPSGTAIALDGTAGNETITLTKENLPKHQHEAPLANGSYAVFNSTFTADNLGSEGLTNQANQQLVGYRTFTGENDSSRTTITAISIIPPVVGVYWLRRTAREFYREG